MKINFHYYQAALPHEEESFAIFIARDAGGNIRAVAKASPWAVNAKPFVSGVHVDESCRRKGIARGLMNFIRELAEYKGMQTLALYVHRDNDPAKRLYENLGFTEFLDDGDNIFMAIRLQDFAEVD